MAVVTPIDVIVYSLSANGVLDDASPMYAYVKVPSIITSVTECIVSLAFRQFSANAKDAASGGGSTSGNGGSTTSSEKTLTIGYSSSSISGTSGAASTGTAHTHSVGSYGKTEAGIRTIDPHTHTVGDHTHSTPNHTHGLTYGTYEEAYPASHSVTVKTYERVGSVWTLRNTSAAITADLADLDLTSVITGPGDWQLRIQSAAAQPNAGRLGLDLYGAITAQIG